MASEGFGTRTDEDSTNAIDPPSVSAAASARLSRTAPRKTLLNAACQASSGGFQRRSRRAARPR